ncbi:MAG: hypothetical protein JO273_08545 [Methylobacteriaceae bacterium]|nr:hypothetical protein [Methylobacteriaceae bacterium]
MGQSARLPAGGIAIALAVDPKRSGSLRATVAWLFGGRHNSGLRLRGLFRRRRRRGLFTLLTGFVGFVGIVLVLMGLLIARLAEGPLAVGMLKAPLVTALEDRMGHGYTFDIGETLLDHGTDGPALVLREVAIKDGSGRVVVAAPRAQVELDLFSLLFGEVKPTRFELVDLDVRFAIMPDRTIAVSAGTQSSQSTPLAVPALFGAPAGQADAATASESPIRGLSLALAATIDAATNPESPLGALVRLGIARGRLVIDDQTAGQTTSFSGLELAFDKDAAGDARLSISADGPNGRWSGSARASAGSGQDRSLDVELRDLSLAEIMLAAGIHYLPFETDVPLSTKIHFAIAPDGTLRSAEGRFGIGAGHFRVDDPDDVPLLIDEIVGGFQLDPATREIKLGPIQYYAQETQLTLDGSIKPPATAAGSWTLALGGSGLFAPQAKGDRPLMVTNAEIAMRYDQGARRLDIDRLALKGPEIDAALTGVAAMTDTGPSLKLKITNGGRMPLRSFAALWPSFIASSVRDWFLQNMLGGTLEKGMLALDLDAAGLAATRAHEPIADDALAFDLTVNDASINVIPGAPPLSGVSGSGHITGRTTTFSDMHGEIAVSPTRRLITSELGLSIPDTAPKPAPATVTARLQGSADALMELLSRDALKPYANLPANMLAVRGQVDGHLVVDFKVGPEVSDPPIVRANAQIANFVADKAFGSEKIEAASLALTLDRSGLRAKGDVRLFGVPGTLELRKPPAGSGEVTVTATLDDAARAKRGLSLGDALTGPVLARLNMPLGDEAPRPQVELDLTRAAVNGPIPGFVKPAGRPGKVTFMLAPRQDEFVVDQLVLDSGAVSLRGMAEFAPDGGFISAKLPQVRISAGDDMRVEAARAGSGLKLTVRANSLDARPFLHDLFGGAGASANSSRDIDLDLKSQSVMGENQRTMTGVDLKFVRRGAQIRQLQLTGNIGRAGVTASMIPADAPTLSLKSADAGGVLGFVNLYRRMEGGELTASIRFGEGRQDGRLVINDFLLRDEPSIRRLVTQAVQSNPNRSQFAGDQPNNIDPSAVPFTGLQINFTRSAGRIALRDSVAWGQEVGASMEGTLDFVRDRVDLHGTFIPAFSFNNLFTKIPVVGILLGGGTHEGLFGLNYRLSGAAGNPTVTVDILSVIAPGILRKIFGVFDGTGYTGAQNDPTPLGLVAPDPQ